MHQVPGDLEKNANFALIFEHYIQGGDRVYQLQLPHKMNTDAHKKNIVIKSHIHLPCFIELLLLISAAAGPTPMLVGALIFPLLRLHRRCTDVIQLQI